MKLFGPAVLSMVWCVQLLEPTLAFTENGFSSGMSFDAVSKAVSAHGGRLQASGNAAVANQQEFMAVQRPVGNIVVTDSFAFCSGRLFFYSTNLAGGFPTFVRLSEHVSLDKGLGRYSSNTFETRMGPWYQLWITWDQGPEKEWLDLGQIAEQTLDVSRSFRSSLPNCP